MAANAFTYIILIVVVVVAIIAIDLLLGTLISHKSTTSVSTTSVPKGPTTAGQISTINYTSNSTGCLSPNPVQAIFNGNFSTGNFIGWNVTGTGFGNAPVNITQANANGDYYGYPWNGYNGTFFATTHEPGSSIAQGNLTTEPFKVTEPYINFQIVSPQDNNLYVEVLEYGKPFIVSHYYTYPAVANASLAPSTFVNASIPVASLICQNVTLRIVAGVVNQKVNGVKFIAVGDFYMDKVAVQAQGIVLNRTVV